MNPTSRQSGFPRSSRAVSCTLAAVLSVFVCASVGLSQEPGTHSGPSASAAGNTLTGQVEDSTGAIIPNASVELRSPGGKVLSTTSTDSAGRFRIPLAAAGDYSLAVTLPGFEPLLQPVHLGRTPPAPLTLVLALASVATSVTVTAAESVDMGSTENNQDAATMSSNDMKSLPILDDDVVATISAFLDTGAAGEGGPTLVIDGVEMKTLGVSPSAIERVSINQNPYSAQYRQPGRGQVEIVTRNTADKFHGSTSFTIRDASLNAKNYFATVRPPEQRRTYEGFLTGPIRPLKDTTFLFSILRQEQNSYEQLDAITVPPGFTGTGNVLAPYRNTQFTMKVAHQINDHHSAYLLYRFFNSSRANRNVGGLNLADAGYTAYQFDMDLTFHDDNAFAPNKINQFNLLFERNIDRDASATHTPSIVVQGAFTAGGAQQDQLQTENNPNISDIVSWTTGPHGAHQLKFGVQLPNLGRRVLEDFSNRQGTYTFDNYAGYLAGTPSSFTIQQGQTRFLTHFDQPAAFFLDEFRATGRLTITPGVRYDFQNAMPGTMDAVQPRLALAYVLDQDHSLVIRTGAGIYMRRVGVNVGQQLARYQYAAEQSYLLTSGICYNPVQQCNTLAAQPPNLFNFAPGISAPFQGFFGLSAERELTKKSTLTIGYEGFRGWHALRSIDINAPLPPFTSTARPNPKYGQILQLQSGGYQKSDSLVVSFRGRLSQYFSGFGQYTYQHADSNTQWSTFSPQNQYDPNAEWGRSDFDQRHRLSLFGTFLPDRPLNLGLGFYASSPLPYTITTGADNFHTGFYNARPAGTPRNSLNAGDSQDLQVRLNYVRKLRPHLKDASPTLGFSASSFNTLNRANFEDYIGVITSPRFRQATSAGSPRRLQLGIAYNF